MHIGSLIDTKKGFWRFSMPDSGGHACIYVLLVGRTSRAVKSIVSDTDIFLSR